MLNIIVSAIRYSTVFLFGATGETIIEKSGHLNLGIPGIMCMGAVGGCTGVALSVNAGMTGFGVVVVAILMSMLLAGLMGFMYGFFTITLRCNQNVTGLVITTFCSGFIMQWKESNADLFNTFTDASAFFTSLFPKEWQVGWAGQLFLSYGPLVYLAIGIALVTAFIFSRTRTGLSLKAVGESPATADAAGINVSRYKYTSCILGAAISGIGGLFYIMDYSLGNIELVIEGLGWLAVALVIFSMWRPLLCILGSVIFGFLCIIAVKIDTNSIAQIQFFKMIPYIVTIIVLIITSIINKRETQPPSSLGISYFREER